MVSRTPAGIRAQRDPGRRSQRVAQRIRPGSLPIRLSRRRRWRSAFVDWRHSGLSGFPAVPSSRAKRGDEGSWAPLGRDLYGS